MMKKRKQKICLHNSSSGLGSASGYNHQSEWKVTSLILNKYRHNMTAKHHGNPATWIFQDLLYRHKQ
jgi:hypothetical protein